jgi:N-acetylglucosaminyldiphosphoundecaprenol N-acetyl-beta-D-mannosaminyltransferase
MVQGLCQVAAKLGRSVFLLGAGPGVAELAGQKLQERVPGLEIAGVQDGYFKPEDEPAIIARIQAARPAVLFVALGIPRQEIWIRAHLEELGVPVCVGVGGSFDVISGLKQRAPVWMQRAGVEWLYRVAKEPWRLPRLAALPRIVWLTFLELLRAPRATEEP